MSAFLDGPVSVRKSRLLRLLRERPEGIDEYGMIKTLQTEPRSAVPAGSLIEPLILFQCHFLVFNTLYRLRDDLWGEQQGYIEINTLKTVLWRYREGQTGVAEHDPLREFYLDESQFETTKEEDVVAILGRFWARFHAQDDRLNALETLELKEPVDYETIKRQYRRLAMRYHPDRGGDTDRFRAIHSAMDVLEKCYRD